MNVVSDPNSIGTWFLILSLFFPRIVLFFWWICGNLPHNTTPFIADFFASIIVPRLLILVWIYDLQKFSTWFWIHLGALVLVWGLNGLRILAASLSNK